MAKPESAGQEKDKAPKPGDGKPSSERFSGADHPLAGKDAQKILKQDNSSAHQSQTQNPFEQFMQTAQKVQKAAQDAVGVAVDTTKQVAHDITQTIQHGGDLSKQLEKSADTVVAKSLQEKDKIDKALGKSDKQSKDEDNVVKALYELKKSDTKHTTVAIGSLIDSSEKTTKYVADAAIHHGDVGKAIEKHADATLDGFLKAKENIDRLIGRNPAASFNENMLISSLHGVDKSLVKGTVGILSLANRPDDKDVQSLMPVAPGAAGLLAVTRNIGDAAGGLWNATGNYFDHVNKVGGQKATEEILQSGANWAMHAKPYDWTEKATDIGTLFVGGVGVAKAGLQGVGWLQRMKAAGQLAGVAEATTVGKTAAAGTTSLEAATLEAKSAGATLEATASAGRAEATVTSTTGDITTGARPISETTSPAKAAELEQPLKPTETTRLEEPRATHPRVSAEEAANYLKSAVEGERTALQQDLKSYLKDAEQHVEGLMKEMSDAGSKTTDLAARWSVFKKVLKKLDGKQLSNEEVVSAVGTASGGKGNLGVINEALKAAGKHVIPEETLNVLRTAADQFKQQVKLISGEKSPLLNAYREATRAVENGENVHAALYSGLQGSNQGSTDLLVMKRACLQHKPQDYQKVVEAIDKEISLRQMHWEGSTQVRQAEQIGTNANHGEVFKESAHANPVYQNMSPDSKQLVDNFLQDKATNKSYAYKIEQVPGGDDHFLVTVVDIADNRGNIKLYQQEINADKTVFGVRHILASKYNGQPGGPMTELPYFRVLNIKTEGKAGISGIHKGQRVEPKLIGKEESPVDSRNKYEIFDTRAERVGFAFDTTKGSFISNTEAYLAYLRRMLKNAYIPPPG